MVQQRLPIVGADDGTWGDILRQFLMKEHVNTDTDNAGNGGHQKITIKAGTTAAGTAPIKFTSGPLMTSSEAGAMEYNGDYFLTDAAGRKRVATYDDSNGATGDMYYRHSSGYFTRLPRGNAGDFLTISGTTPAWTATVPNTATITVKDTNFTLQDDGDTTKQLQFQLSGITTATTRTITVPNVSGTMYVSSGTDVSVADGGTGRSTNTTAYGIIAAGTTATNAMQTIAPGTSGQFLKSAGGSALASFASLTTADISDSTATGRSLLTATDAAAARTAIGAGTGNGDVTLAGSQTLTNKTIVLPQLDSVGTGTLTNVNYMIQDTAGQYPAFSPVPKYLWHDLLRFNTWFNAPTYETYNGSWSTQTLNTLPFNGKEHQSIQLANGTTTTAVRWTWHSGNIAWSNISWWIIGFTYDAGGQSNNVLIESSADGSAWTTRHNSTTNSSSRPVWFSQDSHSGDTYLRLTITTTSAKVIELSSIRALSTRWGDQGGGSEFEYPYDWDDNRNITIGTVAGARSDGALNIGSTTATSASEGIYLGNDTNLYRSAANTLKTDDSLVVGTPGTAAGSAATIDGSQTLSNKTISASSNTITNIAVSNLAASAVVTESEGIAANDNDTTLPTSAAVKDYADTQIANKVDKTATANRVYVTDGSGNTTAIAYSSTTATPSTMVYRGTGGVTTVGTPTADGHAATKLYVDTGLAAKADSVHTHTASQISDSTTVGRSVLTAADAAAARTAIGAGTGSGDVTLTGSQTLTNKSLTAPTLTGTTSLGGAIDFTPDTGTILSFDGKPAITRHGGGTSNSMGVGADDTLFLGAGESRQTMASNITSGQETVEIGGDSGVNIHVSTDNWAAWANRKTTAFTGTGITWDGNTVWHAGNDGAGSGLDADTLDGVQAASFATLAGAETLTSKTLTAPALSGTVTGTYTLGGTPTFPSTVVMTTGSQTLTGKTISGSSNTITNLSASSITSGAFAPAMIGIGDYENIVAGSDFETAYYPWSLGTGRTIASDQAHSGTYSYKFTAGAGSATFTGGAVELKEGERLYVECWVRRDSAYNATDARIRLGAMPGNLNVANLQFPASSFTEIDTWVKKSFTTNPYPAGTIAVSPSITMTGLTAGNLWIDDIVVRRVKGTELIPDLDASKITTGTLPVGRGGTGATSLTGIVKGNGTGAFTAVTAPSGAIVGTTDTQTLTGKTISGSSNTFSNIPASAITGLNLPDGNLVIGADFQDDSKWVNAAGTQTSAQAVVVGGKSHQIISTGAGSATDYFSLTHDGTGTPVDIPVVGERRYVFQPWILKKSTNTGGGNVILQSFLTKWDGTTSTISSNVSTAAIDSVTWSYWEYTHSITSANYKSVQFRICLDSSVPAGDTFYIGGVSITDLTGGVSPYVSQTLTNKTLTSPVLNGTITGTYTLGGTPTFPSTVVTTTGAQTLTNKRVTQRVGTTASSATPSINTDSYDQYTITALATNISSVTVTGTPTDGQRLIIRIKDNGTARSIAWGASWRALGVSLPVVTTASKTIYVGALYNAADGVWDVVAVEQQA